jgi:hypothetical protein
MAKSTITKLFVSIALIISISACGPSLVIQNVDYAQPIESVITVDANNEAHDKRYAIKFNVTNLLESEGTSSVSEVRIIRNRAGYYFVTAAGFNNVYVFETSESELKLKEKIEITSNGLGSPAFNQRHDFIELIDTASGDVYRLDHNGIR